MTCINRHQLLGEFSKNLSPILMSNGLQFSNILGLLAATLYLQSKFNIGLWIYHSILC